MVIRRQYDLTRSESHYLIDFDGESIIVLNIESNCFQNISLKNEIKKMIDEKKIDAIKNKIVNTVSPETIILFGSYAKGEYTEESDLDIVVIWDSDFNPHKRNLFLSRLFPGRDFSLDIFAFTKGEAEKLKNVKGTILYEAFHHGKVIYGE